MSPHVPADHGIYLDHLAHWVPDLEAAADALTRMGFTLTPRTEHQHAPAPGAPVEPAGSANHCIMLESGYLEILTATADTAIGREVRSGIARYVGVHLSALGVADAARERDRLLAEGFAQRPTVALERPTRLDDGHDAMLRFTVIRPEPGTLAEGRVQFLTHHTPQWLWTPRLTRHANGIQALTDVLYCVADVREAAARYHRYLRTPPRPVAGGVRFDFARGALTLLDAPHVEQALGVVPPVQPWTAGYALRARDPARTRAQLRGAGFALHEGPADAWVVHLPSALGGNIAIHAGERLQWTQA